MENRSVCLNNAMMLCPNEDFLPTSAIVDVQINLAGATTGDIVVMTARRLKTENVLHDITPLAVVPTTAIKIPDRNKV